MKGEIYPPNNELGSLFIDEKGLLHCGTWFIVEGIGCIELSEEVPIRLYYLSYCI